MICHALRQNIFSGNINSKLSVATQQSVESLLLIFQRVSPSVHCLRGGGSYHGNSSVIAQQNFAKFYKKSILFLFGRYILYMAILIIKYLIFMMKLISKLTLFKIPLLPSIFKTSGRFQTD